jgi:hypothetical protein
MRAIWRSPNGLSCQKLQIPRCQWFIQEFAEASRGLLGFEPLTISGRAGILLLVIIDVHEKFESFIPQASFGYFSRNNAYQWGSALSSEFMVFEKN